MNRSLIFLKRNKQYLERGFSLVLAWKCRFQRSASSKPDMAPERHDRHSQSGRWERETLRCGEI
jgi:hypothetical protein